MEKITASKEFKKLLKAIEDKDIGYIKKIVRKGYRGILNSRITEDFKEFTPLVYACECSNFEVVKYLTENIEEIIRKDFNTYYNTYSLPIIKAIERGNIEMFKYLLEKMKDGMNKSLEQIKYERIKSLEQIKDEKTRLSKQKRYEEEDAEYKRKKMNLKWKCF